MCRGGAPCENAHLPLSAAIFLPTGSTTMRWLADMGTNPMPMKPKNKGKGKGKKGC